MNTAPLTTDEIRQRDELLVKAFKHAKLQIEDRSYSQLASTIISLTDCEIDGPSIQRLAEADTNRKLNQNKAKDVLAVFVMLHEGILTPNQKPSKKDVQSKEHHNTYYHKYIKATTQNSYWGTPHPLHNYFSNTYWFLYMPDEKGGILRHVVFISEHKLGNTNFAILFTANRYNDDYHGTVGLDDAKSFMLFNLFSVASKNNAFHLKARILPSSKPDCIVGQTNYVDAKESITSDYALMIKVPDITSPPNDGKSPVQPLTLVFNSDYYRNLDRRIRTFMTISSEHRLVLPDINVQSIDDLGEWLKNYQNNLHLNALLEPFVGEYWVYHCMQRPNNVIEIDELELNIYTDENTGLVKASIILSENQVCHAEKIDKHNRYISFLFQGWINGVKAKNLFLEFDAGIQHAPTTEWYVGVLSGFHRLGLYGMTCLCLLVDKKAPNFKREKDVRIKDYLTTRTWQIKFATSDFPRLTNLEKKGDKEF